MYLTNINYNLFYISLVDCLQEKFHLYYNYMQFYHAKNLFDFFYGIGRKYICLIPVNLYGPYDNFNLEDSHVIPGLIHKFYNQKIKKTQFKMFGSGKPLIQQQSYTRKH